MEPVTLTLIGLAALLAALALLVWHVGGRIMAVHDLAETRYRAKPSRYFPERR